MEKKINKKEHEKLEVNIKKEIEKQNKLLRNIFIVLGMIVVIVLFAYLFANSMKNFEYKGVGFTIVDEIAPYRVSIPVSYGDGITGKIVDADYNIYLRNDPRDLDDIPIKGEIIFRPNMVVGVNTENLFCDGDWVIAIGNLQKLEVLRVNLIAKNESEIKVYIPQSNYMFLNIKEANETSIVQKNDNSYDLNVADCEILKATEKLMLEAFIQAYAQN
ncbi:MAG: hypothetical protein PVJ67_01335 [Candidatus Pacearchaeota archaeon]|jgi:hypothetical protein